MYWIARLLAAVILLQTLYFKFGGSEESVYIFTKAGMEPWGRFGTGGLELITAILLLINPTSWIGAFIGIGLMAGALVMHLTVLGIDVMGDGGYLFFLACVVLTCCAYVLIRNRRIIKETYQRRVCGAS